MFFTFDIEANGLLDDTTVDYTCSPYKLKENFCVHCIVLEDQTSGEIIAFYDGPTYILDGREHHECVEGETYTLSNYKPLEYTHYPMKYFRSFVKKKVGGVVGHNIINYDLLVLKALWGMDYSVEPDTWDGKSCEIIDTLILSKTLNPDRYDGHSLESWGKRVGTEKVDFRPHLSQDKKFKHFAADMLYYCIFDVIVNTKAYNHILAEKHQDGWDWGDSIALEKSVAEIITRGTHRGFWFDRELAKNNIQELDKLMEERRLKVEPLLPAKPATKKVLKEYTPPVKQIKMNLEPTSYMKNWVERLNGEFLPSGIVKLLGKEYTMPMSAEPIIREVPATISDTTHIKEWLVGLGWNPSEYKERDLTVDSNKNKLTQEKFEIVVEKYVEQTLNSNFKEDRCSALNVHPKKLKSFLLERWVTKRLKVPTNPSFTKGQEKEVCPNLLEMSEQFPFAKDIVEYLTYRHRRNSILGGGVDWDEDEEEMEKGYLANVRSDGRIPTPADTCGAATSRFKHRVVTNLPRVSSLYGENMRAMFGVEEGYFQIGYDFDSLEARIEAHYCYPYDDKDKSYCNSLILPKPNDVHSKMAAAISEVIQRDFGRTPAKTTKYAATYGAQADKIAKTIGCDVQTAELVFETFWNKARPLKTFITKLEAHWNKNNKKYIRGLDGRKVPTRAKHALANSAFQSAGVICAKRAMVIHDRLLKEKGYAVDFWKEDWKNKPFCQQLIAYHDEAQLEVTKSLVKFKQFAVEEEAIKFKNSREDLSEVGHTKDGKWYVALSEPGYLATKAVKMAGEYYKLNVELTSGYMVHKNWAGTH